MLIVKSSSRKKPGRAPWVLADEIGVLYPAILKRVGTMGGFNRVEGTGRFNRKVFRITVREGTTARGLPTSPSRDNADCASTAAGVKTVVRRVRQQEADEIKIIDDRIARLEAQVAAARDDRERAVRTAWSKANVVRVSEMQELVEEWEAERDKARAEA